MKTIQIEKLFDHREGRKFIFFTINFKTASEKKVTERRGWKVQ
jgi:hypothetical protein